MNYESERLLIVAPYMWLPPASFVLVSSPLPSSTRYGAEAEPRGHMEVERGEAVN